MSGETGVPSRLASSEGHTSIEQVLAGRPGVVLAWHMGKWANGKEFDGLVPGNLER
jgi:hypothetical protein